MKPILTAIKGSSYTKGNIEYQKKVISARKNDLPDIDTPIVIIDPKVLDVVNLFYSLFEKGIKESPEIKQFLISNLTSSQIQTIKESKKFIKFEEEKTNVK